MLNQSKFKKSLFVILGSILAVSFGVMLDLYKDSVIFIAIIATIVFIGLFIYLKKQQISTRSIVSQYILHGYILVYLLIRMSIATFREPIMSEFMLNAEKFAQFSFLFSLGYGGFQLFSGYFLSIIGIQGIAILAIFSGISCAALSLCHSFETLLIGRFILGMFCSGGVCGLGYFIKSTLPKRFFSMIYTVPLTVLVGALNISNNILDSAFKQNLLQWRFLVKVLGISAVVLGVLFFIATKNLPTFESEKEDSEEGIEDEDTSILRLVKNLFTDLRLLALCIYSAASTWLMYPIQDGYSAFFLREYFPHVSDFLGTARSSMAFGCAVLLIFVLSSVVSLEISILFFTLIQIMGVALFFMFGKTSLSILLFSIQFMVFGGIGHIMTPMIVSKYYKGKKTAFYFGALNFSAMLLGGTASQFFAGKLIQKSWNVHKTMLNGAPHFLAVDFSTMIKTFSLLCIPTVLCAIFIFLKREKK